MIMIPCGTPVNLTASGVVGPGAGMLLGFFVNSTTSGTIVIRDGGASGTAISGTITPAAGAFYSFPATCATGCYFTIANTLNVTAFYIQTPTS